MAPALASLRVPLAFLAVYLIWGSTYLAIAAGVATLPPLWMAGARFLLAGAVLYAWARARGAPRPTRAEWRAAALLGLLMMVVGNGGVTWAETRVPSGLAALLVATVPMFMAGLAALPPRRDRPGPAVLAGLALGLAGVALLVGPDALGPGAAVDALGAAVLLAAALAWAAGSLRSHGPGLPASLPLLMGMQQLAGGAMLVAAGAAAGEGAALATLQPSATSLLALLYLVVMGSLVGFTAYAYLLRTTTPARAGSYALVNPLVAVALGAALAGEPVGPTVLAAASVIVAGAALILWGRARPAAQAPPPSPAPAGAPATPGVDAPA